jgi:hypothetical protein
MLFQVVHDLVSQLPKGGVFKKIDKAIRGARSVRILERQYAHNYGKSNPYDTKDDVNPYQLRDEILDKVDSSVSGNLIKYMQSKYPLPKKVLRGKAERKRAEQAWSKQGREVSKQRLADSSKWPAQYQLEANKIQGWGEWVLTNYFYLRQSKNAATFLLRIQFKWPKPQEIPRSINDKSKHGDLALFADLVRQFDQASIRLNKLAQAAYYAQLKRKPAAGRLASATIKLLKQWKKVFTATKGTTASNLIAGIEIRLQNALRKKFD